MNVCRSSAAGRAAAVSDTAPDHLRHRDGRELFQLQLHHRLRFRRGARAEAGSTRRKTLSGGSQAMLSVGCQSVRQSLVTRPAGNPSPTGATGCSRCSVNLPSGRRIARAAGLRHRRCKNVAGMPARHVQRWDLRFASMRMSRHDSVDSELVSRQSRIGNAAIFMASVALGQNAGFLIFHQRIEMLLDLRDAQDFLDGRDAVLDLVPAVDRAACACRAPWPAAQWWRTPRGSESAGATLRSAPAIRKSPAGPDNPVAGIPRNPRRA